MIEESSNQLIYLDIQTDIMTYKETDLKRIFDPKNTQQRKLCLSKTFKLFKFQIV